MNWLFRIKPEKIAADLLYEARRALVEHEAHAEYHQAMAAMFRARIDRIDPRPKVAEALTPRDHLMNADPLGFMATHDPMRNAAPECFNSVRAGGNPYNNPEASKGIL